MQSFLLLFFTFRGRRRRQQQQVGDAFFYPFSSRCHAILFILVSIAFHSPSRKSFCHALKNGISSHFKEARFREKVDRALEVVETILDESRSSSTTNTQQHVLLEDDDDHTWNDKYDLTEYITNMAIAAQMNTLQRIFSLNNDNGDTDTDDTSHVMKTMYDWVHVENKTAILRFVYQRKCTFLREETVKTDVVEVGNLFGTKRISNLQKQYKWQLEISYQLLACPGGMECSFDENNDGDDESTPKSMELIHNNHTAIIITRTKDNPYGNNQELLSKDLNLSWMLRMMNTTSVPTSSVNNSSNSSTKLPPPSSQTSVIQFTINRNNKDTTKTPVRNPDIEQAMKRQLDLYKWYKYVSECIEWIHNDETLKEHSSPILPIPLANTYEDIFIPILPLMVNGTVLTPTIADLFLEKQVQSMYEVSKRLSNLDDIKADTTSTTKKKGSSSSSLSQNDGMITNVEANLDVLCRHGQDLVDQYQDSIFYIEEHIKNQLIKAIGKVITSEDFYEFMRHYNQKFFLPDYKPMIFSHAIRRPGKYPDGILSIESTGENSEPIETIVRPILDDQDIAPPPIRIPINAATSVDMTGRRYLHGWMVHDFEGSDLKDGLPVYDVLQHAGGYTKKRRKPKRQLKRNSHQLAARARQFSSFLLMVGTMRDATTFDPKHAIVVQNKDEVLIPLITEVLPSAKEFRDAIASLSPKQQEFAKAFRAIQLESSVFAVCIIQLKPQLERVLNLPDGALTKEIQLTQQLMSLFIEYQIPSDLLSYDGPSSSDVVEDISMKVNAVQKHVDAVLAVIDKQKQDELNEGRMKTNMRIEEDLFESFDEDYSSGELYCSSNERESMRRPARNYAYPAPLQHQSAPPQRKFVQSPMVVPHARQAPRGRMLQMAMAKTTDTFKDELGSIRTTTEPNTANEGEEKYTGKTPTNTYHSISRRSDDFTIIPKLLDGNLEKYDSDGALRSTIIKAGKKWQRKRQENLLTPLRTQILGQEEMDEEKKNALDLLDAICRSGSLSLASSELHVIIGVTHSFDKSVIGTLVQDNVNPVEKVERSLLLLGSTIFGVPCASLIQDDLRPHLLESFPSLMNEKSSLLEGP